MPPPPPVTLPEWNSVWSEEHEAYYFYNKGTKETRWTNPADEDEEDEEPNGADEGAKDDQTGSEDDDSNVKKRKEPSKEPDSDSEHEKQDTVEPASKRAKNEVPQPTIPSYASFYRSLAVSSAANEPAPVSDPSTGTYRYAASTAPAIQASDADTSALDALFGKIDAVKEQLDEIAPPIERKEDVDLEKLREEAISVGKDEGGYWTAQAVEEDIPEEFRHEYVSSAHFDSRTGKFKTSSDPRIANPQSHFSDSSKAIRQMSFYFDVDAYEKQRAESGGKGEKEERGKKVLSRKEVEEFKRKKEEKRRRRLLGEYGKDSDGLFE